MASGFFFSRLITRVTLAHLQVVRLPEGVKQPGDVCKNLTFKVNGKNIASDCRCYLVIMSEPQLIITNVKHRIGKPATNASPKKYLTLWQSKIRRLRIWIWCQISCKLNRWAVSRLIEYWEAFVLQNSFLMAFSMRLYISDIKVMLEGMYVSSPRAVSSHQIKL